MTCSWAVFILVALTVTRCYCRLSDEHLLIKHLLDNYHQISGIHVRPVLAHNETFKVSYGLALISVLGYDDVKGQISLRVWERFRWTDSLLKWDPEEYGGLNVVRLPHNKIWTPDLTLYNAVQDPVKSDALAVVSNDGTVLWIPPAIFHVLCSYKESHLQLTETCNMKIGSWTYDGNKLDLGFFESLENIDMNDYIQGRGIKVYDVSAKRNVKYYSCCSEPYIDLVFSLSVSRTDVASVRVVFGALVCLCLVSLCVFWLPPRRSSRITLGTGTLLGYVLIFLLSAILPPEGRLLPGDATRILSFLITTCVLIGCSVIPLILHEKGERGIPTPGVVKWIFVDILASIVCVRCKKPEINRDANTRRISETELIHDVESPAHDPSTKDPDGVLDNIDKHLQQVSAFLTHQQRAYVVGSDWAVIAQVCDRLFFLIFCVTFVVIIVSFL